MNTQFLATTPSSPALYRRFYGSGERLHSMDGLCPLVAVFCRRAPP